MSAWKTAITAVCAGLVWCSAGSAAITTTGSIFDNGSSYAVAYDADGTATINGGSVLSRALSFIGFDDGHVGTATVTGRGQRGSTPPIFTLAGTALGS